MSIYELLLPKYNYPLKIDHKRAIDCQYEGDIFIWDLDKTYFRTKLQTINDVIRHVFEKARDKETIPGTPALIKELRFGPGQGSAYNPIYFVTASPPFLASMIEEKMLHDGIDFEGITYKDHVRLLLTGKREKMVEQIGYKLIALLLNRRKFPPHSKECLFGDNAESDSIIYPLYADIIAGRLAGGALTERLKKIGVDDADTRYVFEIKEQIPDHDPVDYIYINMLTRRPVKVESTQRLVTTYNSFQTATHLFMINKISLRGFVRVGRFMIENCLFTRLELARSLANCFQRGVIDEDTIRRSTPELIAKDVLPPDFSFKPPDFYLTRNQVKITSVIR